MNLASLIKRTAIKYPEKIAVIEENSQIHFNKEEKGEFSKEITYKQLWQKIEHLSKAFRTIGVRKNNRVAIILPNCSEFIISFFALLNINAVAVPLKPHMTCWELTGILKNCTPKVVILTSNLLNKILHEKPSLLHKRIIIVKQEKTEVRILDKDGFFEKSTTYTMNDLYGQKLNSFIKKRGIHTHHKQLASINYTYRGYGYPLGAMLTHHNYIHGIIRYIKFFNITYKTIVLIILPINHIFALIGCTLAPLLAGSKLVFKRWKSPREILLSVEKYKINILTSIPKLYYLLLKEFEKSSYNIASLKFGISGGESISSHLINEIKNKMKLDVLNGYGLTESMPVIGNSPNRKNNPKSVGFPGHDVKVKIMNKAGEECKDGEIGEIIVKCPSIMAGYYKKPRETADVIKGGWFYTGDYGKKDQKGYIYFMGLKKPIAKVDGVTVDLNEIKNILTLFDKIYIYDIVFMQTFSPFINVSCQSKSINNNSVKKKDRKKFLNEIVLKKQNRKVIVRYSKKYKHNFLKKEIINFLSHYLSKYKLMVIFFFSQEACHELNSR